MSDTTEPSSPRTPLPSLSEAKSAAKALRQSRSQNGIQISHSQALEMLANQYGYRDWNTLYAVIKDRPPAVWTEGGRVTGSYLSHPFEATVLRSTPVSAEWFRLKLDLDQAVDVVAFASFSAFRSRVNCVVGPDGTTREKTSDGQPHVVLDIG